MKKSKNIRYFLSSVIEKGIFILFVLFLIFIANIRVPVPKIEAQVTPENYKREEISKNHYKVGNNWLKKNEFGVWEMYLEGAPYERGVIYGVLAKEIIESQEASFVNQLNELIPSSFFQHFLRFTIAWMNRDMDEYIDNENLAEIYGISKSFSNKYDYIGPKFYRILYYHAAHDIGHALADLRIVGCTSFAAKGEYTTDGELIIGRNFDFYMGEDFAKDKLILFEKPTKGYPFSSYSWAGFTGVVSGMNNQGLTVTLNAAKSDVPFGAKEPISLLAREILQYAKNIEEAVAIAKKKKTFVSESLLIGSALDNKAVVIEKTPTKIDVFDNNLDNMVCSNHYQSDLYKADKANISNIEMSDSKARFNRMNELIEKEKPLNFTSSAKILRDKGGKNDQNIGLGNPRSINQLIAYHSVIFKPKAKKIWISTYPYQLGEYICYDLNKVFNPSGSFSFEKEFTISKDKFLNTPKYKSLAIFRTQKEAITKHVMFGKELDLSSAEINSFIKSNPESYETYFNLGRYFYAKGNKTKALEMYETSLTKVVASKAEKISIENEIKDLKSILKK